MTFIKIILTLVVFCIICFIGINIASGIFAFNYVNKHFEEFVKIVEEENNNRIAYKKILNYLRYKWIEAFIKWFFGMY